MHPRQFLDMFISCLNNALLRHRLDLQNSCLLDTFKTASEMSLRYLFKMSNQRFCQTSLYLQKSCLLGILKTSPQDSFKGNRFLYFQLKKNLKSRSHRQLCQEIQIKDSSGKNKAGRKKNELSQEEREWPENFWKELL